MNKNIKNEWIAPTSVFWALVKGELPKSLFGILYQQAGGALRLAWHWEKYSDAVKQLVYCGCGFCYDNFPQTQEELKVAVNSTLVMITAEIQVFQKCQYLSGVMDAKLYLRRLFDSARLLGLIPMMGDYGPYFAESVSILSKVEADWLESERNRIM